MKRERLYTYLLLTGAVLFFAGGAYIIADTYLRTKALDFTWGSNILLGIAGILVIAGGYFHNVAKEKEADLFSD